MFNMDNGRTVRIQGDDNVKYADVIAGDEGITMMVRIIGGRFEGMEAPTLVFQKMRIRLTHIVAFQKIYQGLI